MAAALASAVLAAIEARIVTVSGVRIADHLRGVTSSHRTDNGVTVYRDSSVNAGSYRDQNLSKSRDMVVVELAHKIRPKAQRTNARTAMDTAESILQAVADCDETTLAPYHPVWVDTREVHQGEWLLIRSTFALQRDQQLGGT